MAEIVSIEKMSVGDKLRLMERLWEDLSRNPKDISSPAWHGEILARRKNAVENGDTKFEDWEVAKRRLQKRFE